MFLIKFLVILNIDLCFSKEISQESPIQNLTPIVVWTGMGDNCQTTSSYLAPYFEDEIHIHCLRIGDSPTEETINSFIMDVNKQIDMACHLIGNDALLKNG